ncbi:30S ribosomal protein S1 [Thermoactinomyces sp. DSM 45892]|uniref:30S ribosomal protein S1 n=1 Tax=Thermoactinomyces sp. DSM 45892 TaxID=1882753 RepID=UPI000897B804|nr:30S ribosomal protein S1 [Thermoactinomyces sp. DSM 45892]SDZ10321.1 SSU ribosomal protein S1P [Thermoactinomyces sp. DSM 45892]
MTEEMKSLQVGDVIQGKVVKVENSQALVDIGWKSEAILPISELAGVHVSQVSDVLADGQEVEVKIIRHNEEEDQFIVSKKSVEAEKAWTELEEKLESGETLQATVHEVVNGGLVVNVGVRGFIPASLVDIKFIEDFSGFVGEKVTLKVIELDREKNKCILSRKAVLAEELEKTKKSALEKIEAGDVLEGTVQRLTDFGAFVDLGGVDGLVHVSEIAWYRVEHPADALTEGDQVKVKVLKIDREQERISLSIKETLQGPWEKVAAHLNNGDIITGIVRRLVTFGAFVEVAPGVEGLVHISQISHDHIGTPGEVLTEGQEVQVKVLDILPEQKRISLSMKEAEPKPEPVTLENQQVEEMNVTLGDVFPDLKNFK